MENIIMSELPGKSRKMKEGETWKQSKESTI